MGAATGAHWMRLGEELNRYERVFLREREWAQLTHHLINELGTAVELAYVRRFEAAARFLRHPNARRHLVMSVGRFVTDANTQVVVPVLNLLGEVPDPAAADLTLRLLTADTDNRYLDAPRPQFPPRSSRADTSTRTRSPRSSHTFSAHCVAARPWTAASTRSISPSASPTTPGSASPAVCAPGAPTATSRKLARATRSSPRLAPHPWSRTSRRPSRPTPRTTSRRSPT